MTQTLNLQALYFPQRLTNELENIKKYPLTVLEAPSGFGKTTALDRFFSDTYFKNTTVLKHTFFSESLPDYWDALCTMLVEADRLSADALKNIGVPDLQNMSDICEILHDLECPEEFYLVLDNLCGTMPDIELFLSVLSSLSTPHLHVVACVQSVNGKNSFRFSGGNKVYCIGSEDFTFSKEDLRAYFSCAGILLT